MKKVICIIVSICALIALSVLAKEGVERTIRKTFDEREHRVEIVKKWTGPSVLREKPDILLPEKEVSKEEITANLIEENIKEASGVEKTDYRGGNRKFQKVRIYSPALEMKMVESLKKDARRRISETEDKAAIQEMKDGFYLDFLNLKLEHAEVSGNESEIREIKSAIQNYEQYLNTQKKSKE